MESDSITTGPGCLTIVLIFVNAAKMAIISASLLDTMPCISSAHSECVSGIPKAAALVPAFLSCTQSFTSALAIISAVVLSFSCPVWWLRIVVDGESKELGLRPA